MHVMGCGKTTHTTLQLPRSCFVAFEAYDEDDAELELGGSGDVEPLRFALDLRSLVDCLRLFGSDSQAERAVTMSFAPADAVFKLTLEDHGAFTACDLHVLDFDPAQELDDAVAGVVNHFHAADCVAKVLVKSAVLRDIVQDFDEARGGSGSGAAGCVTVRVSAAAPWFSVSSAGPLGTCEVTVPRENFIKFDAPAPRGGGDSFPFRRAAFLHGMKALQHADETFLRINEHGALLTQHMLATRAGGDNIYIEHFCDSARVDEEDEEDDDARHNFRATSSPVF
mmetsp:Transcript_13778/g.47968  ORF Transcript_13778/g.47968 Transcript_13778/m.47968 type:complete len:282 (+) Transcript_13778:259-1104(+)